jgi:ribose 5-phosphate isomerase B
VKASLVALLRAGGDDVDDYGTHDTLPVDYPDYAYAVALAVASGRAARGIVICAGSIGACVAANKIEGVRYAAPMDILTAELARRHHDANLLALDAHLSGWQMIERLTMVFLLTPFDRGRHVARVAKISRFDDPLRRTTERRVAGSETIDAPSLLRYERADDP